ncbi:MAG: glycosyltransferase family 9 protein [Bdellovibrionales bacterium]|nr:glycosyltransferase family 9 protein [Bdellovibrionales bacterium]
MIFGSPMPQKLRSRVKKILVVAVPGMGDALLATPLISSLQSAFPDAAIDILVRSGRESIVEDCPHIQKVISFNYRSRIFSYLEMVYRLFRKYDLAVSTSDSDRSTLSCFYAAPYRIGVVPKWRIGNFWKRLFWHGFIETDPHLHMVTQNLLLSQSLGIEPLVKFLVPRALPLDRRLKVSRSKPLAVLHCYSRGNFKRWEEDRWEQVIHSLIAEERQVVLSYGPSEDERDSAARLSQRFQEGVISLPTVLPFGQIVSLLQMAELFIGVDTSVTHLAAVLGVPTVAIYGYSNSRKWSPWPASHREMDSPFPGEPGVYFRGNVCLMKGECVCPGFLERCLHSSDGTMIRCLRSINAHQVIDAAKRIRKVSERKCVNPNP